MDKELEKKLVAELEKSIVSVLDIDGFTENTNIDSAINELIKIKKKDNRSTLFLMVLFYFPMILLLIPEINTSEFASFLKGFFLAGYFFLILRVYMRRREYDKEIFILNLLKDDRSK
jgi:hypothetical protein